MPNQLPSAAARLATAAAADRFASATLINNAGVMPPIAPLSASVPGDLTLALRVGLEAPMLLCAAFLGATEGWNMPRKVLNISSGLGRRAMASQAAYCAAKAGMDHFTRCMALDEERKGPGRPGLFPGARRDRHRHAGTIALGPTRCLSRRAEFHSTEDVRHAQ